jgi:hypothetical protein
VVHSKILVGLGIEKPLSYFKIIQTLIDVINTKDEKEERVDNYPLKGCYALKFKDLEENPYSFW